MGKRTKSQDKAGATLWTPWGLQGRSERNARQLAIRKLLKKLASLDKRKSLQLVKD
ncbi:hypothetical protein [Mesorhizobium sp. KR1-2]|uniref:hypothetical protein n=1 Tax=Mesorhizobium sp. KR1-2 TaxID=3156609 RepID=UPI0032B5BE6C